jgi:hypothetical protein
MAIADGTYNYHSAFKGQTFELMSVGAGMLCACRLDPLLF